jgi:hypothetical protein
MTPPLTERMRLVSPLTAHHSGPFKGCSPGWTDLHSPTTPPPTSPVRSAHWTDLVLACAATARAPAAHRAAHGQPDALSAR